MIEALARILLETVGRVLVLGLGLMLLRSLRAAPRGRGGRKRRDPSETACFITGMVAWAAILASGFRVWHVVHAS